MKFFWFDFSFTSCEKSWGVHAQSSLGTTGHKPVYYFLLNMQLLKTIQRHTLAEAPAFTFECLNFTRKYPCCLAVMLKILASFR